MSGNQNPFIKLILEPPKNSKEAYDFWVNSIEKFQVVFELDKKNSHEVLVNIRTSNYNPVNLRERMFKEYKLD